MSTEPDFFVVGGTLRPGAPSYVTRPADTALYEHLLQHEFCYVLTARQMGKSSMMVRTARRLQEHSVRSVVIDLNRIGTVPIDAWYIGLLAGLRTALRLPTDVAVWWQQHAEHSAPQRFLRFLQDEVLAQVADPIVVMIDEIDATIALPFRDDFFAAIRAIYNLRAATPEFRRLSFALFGVATPNDLIMDRERTPFNIGRRVVLRELLRSDAEPLRQGLEASYPGQGAALLDRIFYWTNGHPYLTQKLCAAVIGTHQAWDAAAIDHLVEQEFFADHARDDNVSTVRRRVAEAPDQERAELLRLYLRVIGGEHIPDDDRSVAQNRLELTGLISVARGRLYVRNRIYQRIFDQAWARTLLPDRSRQRITLGLVALAVALVALAGYLYTTRVRSVDVLRDLYTASFSQAQTPADRLTALANMFGLAEREPQALTWGRDLFYSLDTFQAKEVVLSGSKRPPEQLVAVVRGVVGSLESQPNRADEQLLDLMVAQLRQLGTRDALPLAEDLAPWRAARGWCYSQDPPDYERAIAGFSTALDRSPANAALRYDRAWAAAQMARYPAALADLEQLVTDAQAALPRAAPPGPTHAPQRGWRAQRFRGPAEVLQTIEALLRAPLNSELLAALRTAPNRYPRLAALPSVQQALVVQPTAPAIATAPVAVPVVATPASVDQAAVFATDLPKFNQLPLPGQPPISQLYGYTRFAATDGREQYARSQGWNAGITFSVPEKTPVLAAGSGLVVFAGRGGPFGDHPPLSVIVRHGGVYLLYGNLAETQVQAGQLVAPGDTLGLSGGVDEILQLYLEARPVPAEYLDNTDPRQQVRDSETAINPVPLFPALEPYFREQAATLGGEPGGLCYDTLLLSELLTFGGPVENRPCPEPVVQAAPTEPPATSAVVTAVPSLVTLPPAGEDFPLIGDPPIIAQRLTIAQWRTYVQRYQFGETTPTLAILRHTVIPTVDQWRGADSIRGIQSFHRLKDWNAGPHLFIGPDGIWLYTPLREVGIHSGTGNSGTTNGVFWYSIGVEMVGNYDQVRPSGAVWEETKAVLGSLSQRLNIPPADLIKLGREYSRNKSTPGWAVTKPWVISEVEQWIADNPVDAAGNPVTPQPGRTPQLTATIPASAAPPAPSETAPAAVPGITPADAYPYPRP